MTKWLLGKSTSKAASKWEIGPFAEAFPVTGELGKKSQDIPPLDYPFNSKSSPFGNAGYAFSAGNGTIDNPYRGAFWSTKVKADYDGEYQTLGDPDILVKDHDPKYEITDEDKLRMYAYIKGEQKEWRIRKEDADKAREIEGDLWELYQKCTRGYRTDWWAESRGDPRYLEGLEQGLIYDYTAGAMAYPDPLDKASRTVAQS